MMDIEQPPLLPPPPRRVPARALFLFAPLIVLLTAMVAVVAVERHEAPNAALEKRMAEMEQKQRALEAQLGELATRPETSVPAETVAPADVAHLQSDVAALSVALDHLQTEVKESGKNSAQVAADAALGRAVGFLQLRAAALSGRAYARELAAFRASGDSRFDEQLGVLSAYAEKGVPDTVALAAELDHTAREAMQASDRAEAPDAWHKILAELEGLVSIRRVDDARSGSLAAMQEDLARDDPASALAAMKALPPEAQRALTDWSKDAEARQTVQDALRGIEDRLTAPLQGTP